MTTTQARQLISTWPDPYRKYALENIRDAERDLLRWPNLHWPILNDMRDAIKAWETVMKAATVK